RRRVDVEAVAVASARDVLDVRARHVDEVDAGGERVDLSVPDRDTGVTTDAHADAVELRVRPGLRAHARAGERVTVQVEHDVVDVDDESVAGAGDVVREHEVRR